MPDALQRQPTPTRLRVLGERRTIALGLLVVVVLAGALLRAEAIGTNARVSTDEHGNVANTNAVLAHQRYRTLRWPPGTPLAFAIATRLTGSRHLTDKPHASGPAQYAQLAIEIATLLLVALVAWRTAGPWAAVLATSLMAFYIPLVLITRTYLSEPLGGLMILATFAIAAWARNRGVRAILAAAVVGGLGCLAREDLYPGLIVIAAAITCGLWRSSHRRAVLTGAGYLAVATLVILPWIIYASRIDGYFVPITDSGPDALSIGSYLPGHGEQYPTVASFKTAVCRVDTRACANYEKDGTAAMFNLIAARYPHATKHDAIQKADLENLRRYALGQPLAFTRMLAEKLWRLWTNPWTGGNSSKHPDTSRTQHLIFIALTLLSLFAAATLTRRWSYTTILLALAIITALNVLVVAQGRDNLRLMPTLFCYRGAAAIQLAQRATRRWGRR